MALGGTLVVSDQGRDTVKGPCHLSPSHFKPLCLSIQIPVMVTWAVTLTYVNGHVDMLRVVHEVAQSHEGFLPRQQVLRLQLLVQLGQGPTAIGNGGLGRVDVGGQVHGAPGMGHRSTTAEGNSLSKQSSAETTD